ncbi:unnamed protein product [Didymodactylos carnosus]|uniref:Exonuclease domain-containing protein n=1 Tax=Didymodactylos carnosus TaxID=1234261 RepID=A0A8S2HCI1_9BILA|nr:unnamed protein product [Didymodactylos carnosus]CAF3623734.1 unnamed protein product [Didymodactylos carnosus]
MQTFKTASNHDEVLVSIDVESVAIGFTHATDDRYPVTVSVVNDECQVVYEGMIKPNVTVVSYLTLLTGLKQGDLDRGEALEEVLQKVHALLSPNVVLVGQSPKSDVKWLQLKQGVHYKRVIDLSEMFKIYNPKYRTTNYFSLAHEADVLLGIDLNSSTGHNATQDAKTSMQLYQKYKVLDS